MISDGNISKIIKLKDDTNENNFDYLLQTNCKIYNGYSGGILINKDKNLFLGIIMFNL